MSKLDVLKRINRAISPDKVDFSAFDLELEKLKKSLEETVNVQTVDDVKRQLNIFQKKIDFGPVLTEIETIRNLFGQNTRELENKIAEKNKELIVAGEAKNLTQLNLLREEISNLKADLRDLPKVDLNPLDQAIKEIKRTQTLFNERLSTINLTDYTTKNEAEKEIKKAIEELRQEINNRLRNIGGGAMNRQMFIGGADPLTRYTDMNLKAGANMTITYANNNTTKKVDVTFASTGGGQGTVRSINSISGDTTAGDTAGTDYVYLVSGTTILTLPTAVANTNLYTVKNVGTGVVTVNTTGGETIDASSNVIMPIQYTAVDLISDTVNWNVT